MNTRLFFNISLVVSILASGFVTINQNLGYGLAAGVGTFLLFLILAFCIGVFSGKS